MNDSEKWDDRAIVEVVISLRRGDVLTANAKHDVADLITYLLDRAHYAEGTADLAMAHRNMAEGAMTVIDPDQWEPCSPVWLGNGGDCAASPRVWNESEKNHYHPKLSVKE